MVDSDKSSAKIDEKQKSKRKDDSGFIHGWSEQGLQAPDETPGK
jgi:hypothetical protein